MKIYSLKKAAPFPGEEAQVIGEELERISLNGVLTPTSVLNAALNPTSPLHKHFEWDDAKAAYQFRLNRARDIIRSIVVTVDGEGVRAYHNVFIEETESREYVSLERALESAPLWSQVITKALEEAQGWATRYKVYKQLAPIVEAIGATKLSLGNESKNTEER